MVYSVEIELPGLEKWVRYFIGIESREEAESIKHEAERIMKARVRKER